MRVIEGHLFHIHIGRNIIVSGQLVVLVDHQEG